MQIYLQGYWQWMHLAWLKMGEGSEYFKTLGAGNMEGVLRWGQGMGTGRRTSTGTDVWTQPFHSVNKKTHIISYGYYINNS